MNCWIFLAAWFWRRWLNVRLKEKGLKFRVYFFGSKTDYTTFFLQFHAQKHTFYTSFSEIKQSRKITR